MKKIEEWQAMDREQRLAAINTELAERNLRSLPKLGDQTKGEIEITGIVEIYEHSKRFFTDVKFATLFPGAKDGEFTIRFNANGKVSDGAVMAPLVNGRFAIVKQWRPALGRWTYEIPRGFGEKLDQAKVQGNLGTLQIGDLPLGTLMRELGEEVMFGAEISSLTHLGNIAENTGTHAVALSYFLVQIRVPEELLGEKLKGSEELHDIKVELWDTERVRMEIGKKLCDNHSLTALFLAFQHIETLPKLG